LNFKNSIFKWVIYGPPLATDLQTDLVINMENQLLLELRFLG